MASIQLTCINCPLGCPLVVDTDEQGSVIKVTGQTCKRGEDYGRKEVTAPTRTVTSTVALENGLLPVVSVRTAGDIPKGKIFECMAEIRKARAAAPVKIGQVLIENVAGTGVDIIATVNVEAAS